MDFDFGKRLKKLLNERNMKQSELAEKTGIGKSAISQYMSGLYKPKTENLTKIAKALNITVADFFGDEIDDMEYLDWINPIKIPPKITSDPALSDTLQNASKEELLINTISFKLHNNSNVGLSNIKRGNKVDVLKSGEGVIATYDVELVLKAYELKAAKQEFSLKDIENLANLYRIPDELKGVTRKQYIKFMGEAAMFFDDISISDETKEKMLLSYQNIFYDAKERNKRKK